MPIIIPSSHSYEIVNDKITSNKISGVSFSEIRFAYRIEVSGNWESVSNSNSNPTQKTIYGDWLYKDDSTRERIKISLTTESVYAYPESTNLDKYDVPETSLTGYLHSQNYGNIDFNIPIIKSNIYEIKVPPPDIKDEALEFFAKTFLRNNISVNIAFNFSGETDMLFINKPKKLTIYTETEKITNDEWKLDNSTTKLSDTINTAVYSVYVGRYTIKKKSTGYLLGNNANYSLSNTDFFKDFIKIDGKTLGNFISERIIESYKNGKETAIMTCIIGNYFDENGNKVISIDDGRMTFDLYDEVVPMIYTNLGDRPISLTEDGKAKIFKVLKSRIFYDGAVWQELTLQETGETVEILNSLSAPRISINGDILNITRTNNENQTFDIYINNALHTTTTSTELDLSTLNLSYGTYSIYVISKAQGFSNSKASNVETYILQPYIIEAGTYIFNEVLQVDKRASCGDMGGDIIVNFYNGEQPIASTIIQIDFVPTSSLSIIHHGGSIYIECSEGTWTYTVQNIIEESVHRGTIPEEYLETCRTFYIREAIEVSKDFYNVFMENVIKIQ